MQDTLKLTRLCQQCGKSFHPWPGNVAKGHGKFCSVECAHDYRSVQTDVTKICEVCGKEFVVKQHDSKQRTCSIDCANIAKRGRSLPHTPEWNRKIGEANRQPHPWLTEYNLKHKKYPEKGTARSLRTRFCQQCGIVFHPRSSNSKFCSPECYYINMRSIVLKTCPQCGKIFHPSRSGPLDIKKGRGKFCSRQCWWQSREGQKARMVSCVNKPTKPEKQLTDILNRHFPDFKYNGDFGLGITIGGLIPDFVNTNGKKEVIEVFGDYWHNQENLPWHRTELGRTMAYNSVGYKTLIIWEHDLKEKSEGEIVNMVKAFTGGGKCQR
jgi:hypothetical protein